MVQIEVSDDATTCSFTFHALENAFACLSTPQASEQLTRWGLDGEHAAPTPRPAFRFGGPSSRRWPTRFCSTFSTRTSSSAAGAVSAGRGAWTRLGPVTAIGASASRPTCCALDFFDRLEAAEVVRGGHISKCFDAQVGEVLASDRLRLALLDEAAEEWSSSRRRTAASSSSTSSARCASAAASASLRIWPSRTWRARRSCTRSASASRRTRRARSRSGARLPPPQRTPPRR